MGDADRLDKAMVRQMCAGGMIREVLPQLPHDAPGDLGDLKRMGQAGPIEIAVPKIENLCLPLKPSERGRMDDASIVDIGFIACIFALSLPIFLPRIPAHIVAIPLHFIGKKL